MKAKKGEAGYIDSRKKKVIIKCIIEFAISIAIFVLGILQTKSRLNVLTVVAILGCLPASKALVEVIMILPHKTIAKVKADQIETAGQSLIKIYDMVFTNEKKIMPVESIVICKRTLCGYTPSKKVNPKDIEQHLKQYLSVNGISNVTIKIFDNFDSFINREKELNVLNENVKEEMGEYDDTIRRILLNLSI